MSTRGERRTGVAVRPLLGLVVGSIGSLMSALNLWVRDTWTAFAAVAAVVGVAGLFTAGVTTVRGSTRRRR